MTTPAKTTAERQRAYRQARAAEGLTEVRGIYAPPEKHAAIREAAAKVLRPAKPVKG